jgi:hypothetical protein
LRYTGKNHIMRKNTKTIKPVKPLPVDIVLAPAWWYKNSGITFERDFFFHPKRRVEEERKMEQILYQRWGEYGLGMHRDTDRPEVGAVHLAAGFMISEMLGCAVEYRENQPPLVIPAHRDSLNLSPDDAFRSETFRDFSLLFDRLKTRHHHLCGDVNWGGILNIALDLRGQALFMDMLDRPDEVFHFFTGIAEVIYGFVTGIQEQTGSSSVSVNRNVIHFTEPVFLHSECSLTMISVPHYRQFLFPFDRQWNLLQRPYGIHYCGSDSHRFAEAFAQMPGLDFLDVGWGGNVEMLRKFLPRTFLNIRLSPVEILHQSAEDIETAIRSLVRQSGNPWLTGVCCINMDDQVPDEKITTIFRTVEELRKELTSYKQVQINNA